MKTKEYFTEDKPIISLQRARELLPQNKMSDEELRDVLLNIQQFCEMTYDLYLMKHKDNIERKEENNEEDFRMAA